MEPVTESAIREVRHQRRTRCVGTSCSIASARSRRRLCRCVYALAHAGHAPTADAPAVWPTVSGFGRVLCLSGLARSKARDALLAVRGDASTLGLGSTGLRAVAARRLEAGPASSASDELLSVSLNGVPILAQSDGRHRFEFATPSPPEGDVIVSTMHDGKRWSQSVHVEACERVGEHQLCSLPRLDYSARRLMSISKSDAMIKERRVLGYTPSSGCDHLAGRSIHAGYQMFLQKPHAIEVSLMDDGDDLQADESYVGVCGSYQLSNRAFAAHAPVSAADRC